jgi:nicotinamidase-related amidase
MGREMLPRLKDFIAAFRALHIPVIYTRAVCMADGSDLGALSSLFPEIRGRSPFQEGSIGVEICEDLRPEPDDYVISHRRFNAFYGTDLEIILRAKGIDTLIFAGVNTNMSVESTAREAFCRDFRVVIASDLTGATPSRDGTMTAEQVHEAALRMFDGLFGYVLSSDEIMTKLLPA